MELKASSAVYMGMFGFCEYERAVGALNIHDVETMSLVVAMCYAIGICWFSDAGSRLIIPSLDLYQ